jgi:tetratricopeptide (TPR) repeat protein
MLASRRVPCRVAAAVAGLFLWVGCSSSAPDRSSAKSTPQSASTQAVKLEQVRRSRPRDIDSRLELADVYYGMARKALDAGRSEEYVAYLRKAQDVVLEATRIDPKSPRPHTWIGIITAYQGDLDAAARSFRNALRLAQRGRNGRLLEGTYYSNVAHIAVYRGKLSEARLFLQKAMQARAPVDELDRIAVLAAWKANDMTEAREVFDSALITSSPSFASQWDQVDLPQPMKNFDDFASVCCRNPTCGPHMQNACKAAKQPVREREVTLDTLREEMELERERRRKLKEIYGQSKELEIKVDEGEKKEPDAKDDAGTSAPSAPAPPTSKPAPR